MKNGVFWDIKSPVRTSQKSYNVSATELSWLILYNIEVSIAVTMNYAGFWDISLCGSFKNRRFVGTHRLHNHGDKNRRARNVS
jgi:hypothetical protein